VFTVNAIATTTVQMFRLRSTSDPPPRGPAPLPTPKAPESPASFPECMSTRKIRTIESATWTTARIVYTPGRVPKEQSLHCPRVRPARTSICVVAAVGALATASPAAGAARPSCNVPGSRTVLSTATARVYYTGAGTPWVCHRRTGRRTELDTAVDRFYAPGDATLGLLRLAGDRFAFTWMDPGIPAVWVQSMDLRTGRFLHRLRIRPSISSDPADVRVAALVARPSGAVAWTQMLEGERSVWRLDAHGPQRLDAGPGIGLFSLRVSRAGRLTWRRDGAPRAATLR
jgi:hypothetical protein